MRAWLFASLSPSGPHYVRYSAALRSYGVLRLFIGAELNDLEGVSVLQKTGNYFEFFLPAKRSL